VVPPVVPAEDVEEAVMRGSADEELKTARLCSGVAYAFSTLATGDFTYKQADVVLCPYFVLDQ
jgi:hypothetical protein